MHTLIPDEMQRKFKVFGQQLELMSSCKVFTWKEDTNYVGNSYSSNSFGQNASC